MCQTCCVCCRCILSCEQLREQRIERCRVADRQEDAGGAGCCAGFRAADGAGPAGHGHPVVLAARHHLASRRPASTAGSATCSGVQAPCACQDPCPFGSRISAQRLVLCRRCLLVNSPSTGARPPGGEAPACGEQQVPRSSFEAKELAVAATAAVASPRPGSEGDAGSGDAAVAADAALLVAAQPAPAQPAPPSAVQRMAEAQRLFMSTACRNPTKKLLCEAPTVQVINTYDSGGEPACFRPRPVCLTLILSMSLQKDPMMASAWLFQFCCCDPLRGWQGVEAAAWHDRGPPLPNPDLVLGLASLTSRWRRSWRAPCLVCRLF